MTICLPAAIAARACAMPAAGAPVASTTTSTSGCWQAALPSVTNAVRARRAASQPTVRQAARARSGSRLAITAISRPGVVGTWHNSIEPNFPAPIKPTRTGLPVAARSCSRRWRLIEFLRSFGGGLIGARVVDQRIVGDRRDRREVAMRDPVGPRRLADMVRDRAQGQIDDD